MVAAGQDDTKQMVSAASSLRKFEGLNLVSLPERGLRAQDDLQPGPLHSQACGFSRP